MAARGLSNRYEDQVKKITASELIYYIERVDEKMNELVHKNGKAGDQDEINKAFMADIEVVKKDQESLKKRVNELMKFEYCSIDLESLPSLHYEECEALKVEEDGINDRLIELSLRFDSELEEEMEQVKEKVGLKERLLEKLIEFDSFDDDDLEDEDSVCKGDEKEYDGVRANNMMEMNHLHHQHQHQLDSFDAEFYTNIEGLKEDIRAMIFQDDEKKSF